MIRDFNYPQRRFREMKTFTERCNLSKDLIDQYPHCVPVIVERASDEKRLPNIDKRQFLVPHEMVFGSFFYTIRKRLGMSTTPGSGAAVNSSSLGVWIYAGKTPITTPSSKMSEIYHYYKDNDGFLYLQYKGEHVFGGSDGDGAAAFLKVFENENEETKGTKADLKT